MTLATGTRLGPYEILAPLGAGGMGEVYTARDTRLGRMVALKVLPQEFARDPDRLARFEREARAASSLTDQNIVTLFDVGNQDGIFYFASELVEGSNLRNLLAAGKLPLRRAVELAEQIASGLAAAHEKGIVHRDLKPENVLITKSGAAKIADFGLAKRIEASPEGNSQAITAEQASTETGVIMGTAAYMSPEQARGFKIDWRSDQFSLGLVLYEMLTGQHAFRRLTAAETLTAIIHDEPEPVQVRNPSAPAQLVWISDRCLAKDPEERYASTRDLAHELATVRTHLADLTRSVPAQAGGSRVQRPRRAATVMPWIIAALAVAAALGVFVARGRRPVPASHNVMRFFISPPAGHQFGGNIATISLAFSPDGSRLAFIATPLLSVSGSASPIMQESQIWIRPLSETVAHPVAGTEGANSFFWSLDGKSLGFSAGNQLKRIDLVNGGAAVPICRLPSDQPITGAWGNGVILFTPEFGGPMYRVSANGGEAPRPFIQINQERSAIAAWWPTFLPDGKNFLYLGQQTNTKNAKFELMIASLDGTPPRAVAPISSRVEYVDPGFLIFASDGTLLAQHFDIQRGHLTGPLLPVAPAVDYFYTNGWACFAASRNGTLLYADQYDVSRLTWFDRSGHVIGEIGRAGGEIPSLSLSPDGRKVLFCRTRTDLGTEDIWMLDLARGVETRITSDPDSEVSPRWLPDMKRILYSVVRGGVRPHLVLRDLASGIEEPLLPAGQFQRAQGVTPDGRQLLFSMSDETGTFHLWTLPLEGNSRTPLPLVNTKYDTEIAGLSPDGKTVAYISNESGEPEVYVAPFEKPQEAIRLSTNGATCLGWSHDGKKIYYATPDRRLFEVPVETSPSLQGGGASLLFTLPTQEWESFSVAPDGRFLASVHTVSSTTAPVTVVVNWLSEVAR